jgi:hypothetical protein
VISDLGTCFGKRTDVDWIFQEERERECWGRLLEIARLVGQVMASTLESSVHYFRKPQVSSDLAADHIYVLEPLLGFLGHKVGWGCPPSPDGS